MFTDEIKQLIMTADSITVEGSESIYRAKFKAFLSYPTKTITMVSEPSVCINEGKLIPSLYVYLKLKCHFGEWTVYSGTTHDTEDTMPKMLECFDLLEKKVEETKKAQNKEGLAQFQTLMKYKGKNNE